MAPIKIVVTVNGGIVQSVSADDPQGVVVYLLDFDTDGADPDEIVTVKGQRAFASRMPVDDFRGFAPWVAAVDRNLLRAAGVSVRDLAGTL